MRVLIVEETYDGGHYLNYVQYLIQAFAPLDCEIVVALPKAAQDSSQFKVHLQPHQALFRLACMPPRYPTTRTWQRIKNDARIFSELIDHVKPDAVYLPTADGTAEVQGFSRLTLHRSVFSRVYCEALLMWMPAAYDMSSRPQLLTKLALHAMPFDIVHYMDRVVFDWVTKEVGGKAAKTARFIPDPIEQPSLPSRSEACAMLNLPEQKKLIMSIGVQDHRKGVDYLIRACACWQPAEPASVVLAGKLSTEIRELVSKEYHHLVDDGRLIILDRYLTNDDFYGCFAAGDLIVTPYRPYPGPSGIILHAAAAGKMVLAADFGWFSYMVPKFSLGSLCEPRDTEEFAATFNSALHDAEKYKMSGATKRLMKFHQPQNFVLQWRRGLSKLLGKSEESSPHDWNWVLSGKNDDGPG